MTLEEIKSYLHIDYDEDDDFLNELISVSEIYIDSMVGTAYKSIDKSVKMAKVLQKKLIARMYENRSTEVNNNTKQDTIVTSILDKLALDGEDYE